MRVSLTPRVIAILLVLPAALVTACSPASGATIDWSVGPIKFSLSSDGQIEVSGQKQWVTAVGTFAISEDHGVSGQDEKLVLVIRHLQEAAPVDDVFTVPTTADVLIDTHGRTQVGIRGRTVRVDATQAEIREITLKGVVWEMPDLQGQVFQDAQDELERLTEGVVTYRSAYDATGRNRYIMWAADWRVCTQSVPAGQQISADTKIGFGVVEVHEACPDGSGAPRATWLMPSFVGRSLDDAENELRQLSEGAIGQANTHDATGAGRRPYLREGWVICSQTPPLESGISVTTPIEFGVVADGESCPATVY